MKLSDTTSVLRDLRRRPFRTVGLLLLLLIVIVSVHFVVTFSGEKARQFANLSPHPDLKDALRITYHRIESAEMLSRFLAGYTYVSDAGFEATPFIANNKVYRDLEELLDLVPGGDAIRSYRGLEVQALVQGRQPIDRLALSDFRVYRDGEFQLPPSRVPAQEKYTRFMKGIGAVRPMTTTGPYEIEQLLDRLQTNRLWVLDFIDMGNRIHGVPNPDLYSYFFVGLTTARDLSDKVTDPLTRRVAKANPNKMDLGIEKAYFLHGQYLGHISVRELSLLTLDIENISDSTVHLSSLKTQWFEPEPFSLATEGELTKAFSRVEPGLYDPPVEKLLPGEHLLVPLRIALGISTAPGRSQWYYEEKVIEESTFPQNTTWWKDRPDSEVSIPVSKGLSSTGKLQVDHVPVQRQTLEAKADLRGSFVDRYYLASALEVTELAGRTRGTETGRISVRRYDPTNVVFRGSDEVGSCPILYAEVGGYWERLGPVFPFAVGRNFVMNFATPLPVGSSRVKFVEEEQEQSFIDGVLLVNTNETSVSAENIAGNRTELLAIDGQYTRLSFGDELVFELPAPTGTVTNLVVRGYYLPLLE